MARRRFQKGSLIRCKDQWKVRYLVDELCADGTTHRKHKKIFLGTTEELPTEKLALRAKDELMRVVNGQLKAASVVTFNELTDRWERKVLPMHKLSSQDSERWHLRVLRKVFADTPLADITGEDVQTFIASRSAAGLRPKTIRNMITTLRLILRAGESWGYLDKDPTKRLKFPPPDLKNEVCYTTEQAHEIIEQAPLPFNLMFGIVAETGMRGGEVCGLSIDDIDFDKRTLTVKRSAWRGKLQTPKTPNAVRRVALSCRMTYLLQNYIKSSWKPNKDRLLFYTNAGTPFDRQNIVRFVLRPITDNLNLPKAGMHALRHGNSTKLDQLRAPVKVRMARLGHGRLETTLDYTHVDSEDDQKVAEEIGAILYPNLTLPPVSDTKEIAVLAENVGA